MEEFNERIWVVSIHTADGASQASVFDNKADATNFYDETIESPEGKLCDSIRLTETVLMRRDMLIQDDESPWGLVAADINKELVEGLMEEIVPKEKIAPGAAERFIKDKSDEVRKRAQAKFNDYLRDELNVCLDEWCKTDMEY